MCDCVFPIFNLLISVGETEYQSNGSSTHLKLLLVSMLEAGMRQRGSSSGVTVLVPTKWHLDSSTSSPRHPLVRYCMSADMCSMRVEAFGMYSHYVGSDPNVMPHPSEIFIVSTGYNTAILQIAGPETCTSSWSRYIYLIRAPAKNKFEI